jgi:hypothetical protein
MLDPPESRIPVEIWELILLEVILPQSMLVFATSCSASDYLIFKRTCGDGENSSHRYEYVKSLQNRRTLRGVCRSWMSFFDRLDLRDRWSHLPSGRENDRPIQADWAWRLDIRGIYRAALTSLLSEWTQMGAEGRHNTQLTRMEILEIDSEFFTRLLKGLCDVAPVLKNLRSLGLTITDEKYTIMEKLSIHFPELTHLTLCLHRVEHRLRINDPQLEERGSSMFKKLEVLFLLPGKRAFDTSHWNFPSLRHVYIRPADSARFQTYEFLKRHAQSIETIDLDNNDKPRIGVTLVQQKNVAFPTDFWETFINLKLLRCSFGRIQIERVPEQHHPIECFVLTDSVEQATQLCNVLRPWVEGHNVKVLKRIVLYGYFLTKGYHLCEKGELPQLIEQLRRNGTRLINPAGKSWI